MGGQKLSLRLGERTLLGTVLHHLQSASLDERVCVLRPDAENLARIAAKAGAKIAVNALADRGRTSSIKAGLRVVRPQVDTVLIVPGDMPFIRPDTFERVVRAARDSTGGIAVACHQGKRGHPVAFHRSRFQDILSLGDDEPLYVLTRGDVSHVALDDAGILININTPQQYEEACDRIGRSPS